MLGFVRFTTCVYVGGCVRACVRACILQSKIINEIPKFSYLIRV